MGTEPDSLVRVFPGLLAQAREARRWVRAWVAAAWADDMELITAELFANAVLHTRSGDTGGTVTVIVTHGGVIHVHDHGTGQSWPRAAAGREDFGRGLLITAALSSGLARSPAARCPLAWPEDPAAVAGGCCVRCRPASQTQAPDGAAEEESRPVPATAA